MDIQGPRAAPEPSPPKKGLIAGCLSGCGTLLAGAAMTIGAGLGAAYEVTQPAHRAQVESPDGRCDFSWWRSAVGGARYRIVCTAGKRPVELSKFKLLSGPSGVPLVEAVEDWGQRPWEDQRPLSGEEIVIDPGRTWRYDGTISLGMVPYVGPAGTVTWTAEMDETKVTARAVE